MCVFSSGTTSHKVRNSMSATLLRKVCPRASGCGGGTDGEGEWVVGGDVGELFKVIRFSLALSYSLLSPASLLSLVDFDPDCARISPAQLILIRADSPAPV